MREFEYGSLHKSNGLIIKFKLDPKPIQKILYFYTCYELSPYLEQNVNLKNVNKDLGR